MKITDYTVVESITIGYLIEETAGMIKQGWEPFGGVCVTYLAHMEIPSDRVSYTQAFVKRAAATIEGAEETFSIGDLLQDE